MCRHVRCCCCGSAVTSPCVAQCVDANYCSRGLHADSGRTAHSRCRPVDVAPGGTVTVCGSVHAVVVVHVVSAAVFNHVADRRTTCSVSGRAVPDSVSASAADHRNDFFVELGLAVLYAARTDDVRSTTAGVGARPVCSGDAGCSRSPYQPSFCYRKRPRNFVSVHGA